jgi:hypothetical protein
MVQVSLLSRFPVGIKDAELPATQLIYITINIFYEIAAFTQARLIFMKNH